MIKSSKRILFMLALIFLVSSIISLAGYIIVERSNNYSISLSETFASQCWPYRYSDGFGCPATSFPAFRFIIGMVISAGLFSYVYKNKTK